MPTLPLTLSRSILTILVPGIVAVAPWALALVQHTTATLGYDDYSVLGNSLLFAVVIIVGSTCEGLGTILETRWDRKLEGKFEITENWYAYLSRTFESEPVGYKYISRLVTSLYFELAMLVATPIFAVGGWLLASLRFPAHERYLAIAALMYALLAMSYLFWQAKATHVVLCTTRRELNRRLGSLDR